MTLYEFKTTSKSDQINYVQNNGVHVANRVGRNCPFELYSIGEFYVEVSYRRGGMLIARTFKTFKRLEPYLGNISLNGLLS